MFEKVKYIIDKLKKHNYKAYIVGGAVRDILLGIDVYDFDIVTNATPDEIEKIFENTISVGKQFGVILVVLDNIAFEVATFRKDNYSIDGRHPTSIEFCDEEEDALRRDFTINGMFADIEDISYKNGKYFLDEKKVIDFVGGINDLKSKKIKFIGDPNIRILEDHLRIIRAIRFKNKLNFKYDKKTKEAIINNIHLVNYISKERIQDELTKILHLENNYKAFNELYKFGILQIIMPEIKDIDKIKQEPTYHKEGNVWKHTLKCLKNAYNESSDILWALLLHDIGKIYTTFVDETGRIRANNHDVVGAEYAEKILKRLKFSNKSIDKITWLIKQHLRVHFIFDMKLHKQKMFCYHEYFPDLLKLHYYDEKGRIPSNINHHKKIKKLYEKLIKEKEKDIKPFLNGNEIMQILNIPPSKKIGQIIDELKIAQYENKVDTKEKAIEFIKNLNI